MKMLTRPLLSLVASIGLAATVGAADRPNVIYIMADELGYYELSCLGNPHIQTPNLDRMAGEGIRFTQALAGSSVCAPTRCCLMTGKHSGHTSVRSNGGGTPLRAGESTIASMLKKAGYATGGFGKWGCGGRGSTGVPEDHGFDLFFGYYDQVHAHTYYPPYLVKNSKEVPLAGNRGMSDGSTYSHYLIHDAAMNFIREHKDGPFFCYMPYTPPHGIFDIPDTDPAWPTYKDKPWPEEPKRYAAMVSMIDRQVGEVFDLLRELDLEDNTLVFFCGDNGGNDYFRDPQHPRGFHGANVEPKSGVEFRGTKGTLYEGGLRIPMIARWPGKIDAGRVSDHLWYFPDVMPTVADITGTRCPDDSDGISIVPELLGPSRAGRRQDRHEYLYWELGGQIAVRAGDFKAVKPRRGDWELYDLGKDVSERNNLAESNRPKLEELQQIARQASDPVREGTFSNPEIHERDRQAKFGGRPPRRNQTRVFPKKGLLSNTKWKIIRFSSQSEGRRQAANAIDGDPKTHWHTRFGEKIEQHPHELVIDLGGRQTVEGFRYLARQDGGWNGAIKDCEFYVGDSPTTFGEPVARASFQKSRDAQEVRIEPTTGRYVRLVTRSEVNGGPWASVSELGVIGKGK